MAGENLIVENLSQLHNGTLLLGFTGWMDGGDVSTGSINYLIGQFDPAQCAAIDPEGFYVFNFTGDIEISSMMRPYTRIVNGLVEEYKFPENVFYCDTKNNIAYFIGREPDVEWEYFGDCLFEFCTKMNIATIYSCGSVAGLTPHTREPRIVFVASEKEIRDRLETTGLRPSNYEGPSGIMTYLVNRAGLESVSMASLIAEIPAYVQGYNPRSIETMTKLLARLLDLKIDMDTLHEQSIEFEQKITELVNQQDELPEKVMELERDYDREAFDREMGDLKNWLGRQGLRVD